MGNHICVVTLEYSETVQYSSYSDENLRGKIFHRRRNSVPSSTRQVRRMLFHAFLSRFGTTSKY